MEMIGNFVPYWPLAVGFVLTSILAQILKNQILTISLAAKNKVVFWLRRLFPVVLLALGGIVGGFWPGELVPGIEIGTHKVFAMMGASGASIVGWNILKSWVKTKYKVDIGLQTDEKK